MRFKITTTTVIGVTGSFHTTTFHGRLVSTASSTMTSDSVVVVGCDFTEGTTPVSQTTAQKET